MADRQGGLPPHPEEARLRRGENELAVTLKELTRKVATALKQHDREASVVLLTQLATTANAGRQAMTKAIQDQMDVVAGEAYEPQDRTDR